MTTFRYLVAHFRFNPVWLFGVLALFFLAGALSGVLTRRRRRCLSWPLLTGSALAVLAYMATGIVYLLYPSFGDHNEPMVAILAMRVLDGLPVYGADGVELSTFPYGPVFNVLNACFVWLCRDPVGGNKMFGLAFAWGGLLFFFLSCKRVAGTAWSTLAAGMVVCLLFPFSVRSFWGRPESMVLFATCIVAGGVIAWRGWAMDVLVMLGVAMAVGAKAHTLLIQIPLLVMYAERRSLGRLALVLAVSGFATLLPFLTLRCLDLDGYLVSLLHARNLRWSRVFFENTIAYTMILYLVPCAIAALVFGRLQFEQKPVCFWYARGRAHTEKNLRSV